MRASFGSSCAGRHQLLRLTRRSFARTECEDVKQLIPILQNFAMVRCRASSAVSLSWRRNCFARWGLIRTQCPPLSVSGIAQRRQSHQVLKFSTCARGAQHRVHPDKKSRLQPAAEFLLHLRTEDSPAPRASRMLIVPWSPVFNSPNGRMTLTRLSRPAQKNSFTISEAGFSMNRQKQSVGDAVGGTALSMASARPGSAFDSLPAIFRVGFRAAQRCEGIRLVHFDRKNC